MINVESTSKKVLILGNTSKLGLCLREYISDLYYERIDVDMISLRNQDIESIDLSVYDSVVNMIGKTKSDDGNVSDDECLDYYNANCTLAIRIAKQAKRCGVKHFIFVSTMMVYGNAAPIGKSYVITPDTQPMPQSAYGESKLKGEQAVQSLADDNFMVSIIREPVIYGEHFNGEFNKLLNLTSYLRFFPNVDSTKSYIYEKNLCELFCVIILEKRGGVFCPRNLEQPTTSELYQIMCEATHKNCLLMRGWKGILIIFSHFTRYVNVVFNDINYSEEFLNLCDIDYQKYRLKESIERCLQ